MSDFKVVVIGASAGGVEAFGQLVAALPAAVCVAILLPASGGPGRERPRVPVAGPS